MSYFFKTAKQLEMREAKLIFKNSDLTVLFSFFLSSMCKYILKLAAKFELKQKSKYAMKKSSKMLIK